MSIVYKDSKLPKGVELPKDCFYCGKKIMDKAFTWLGDGYQIYLHQNCTSKLASRMILDASALAEGISQRDNYLKNYKGNIA